MADAPRTLRLLALRAERPVGVNALRVDLGAFIATTRDVGPDAALLLLTVRALALRDDVAVQLTDLSWMLGATTGNIFRWLEALERSGLAVWHARGSAITIEIARPEIERPEIERTLFAPDDHPGVTHVLPTHWFIRTLPLVGRRALLVYLFLRSHERASGLTAPLTLGSIARACGIRSGLALHLSLSRLGRHGLVVPAGRHGQFILADPQPLTQFQRRYLALLASGTLPVTGRGRIVLAFMLLAPVAVLAWLLSLLHR
ncbi:MAG: hypothetical protein DIJKHBIC_02318 [Thermoanaerobaculia bacterium]|nr:hypothetical protein [Thermoanaerobaculia bacterium]